MLCCVQLLWQLLTEGLTAVMQTLLPWQTDPQHVISGPHAGPLTTANQADCNGDDAQAWQTDLQDALNALHAGGALASCRLQAGKQLLHCLLAL